MKLLVHKLCLILCIVGILSVGIDVLYRHTYKIPYQWPKNLWILPEIPAMYDIVKVGNSHAEEGILFDRYNLKSVSLTSVAQSFEYDLANLKMHSRQIKQGALIIIGISPVSFSQKKPGRQDSLQTMYYDGRLSPFLIPNLKIEDYLVSQIFPFFRSGYLWRQKYNDSVTKRIATEETKISDSPSLDNTATEEVTASPATTSASPQMPVEELYFYVTTIRNVLDYPQVSTSARLTDSMNFVFNKWYNTLDFEKQYFAQNRKDLERLIVYCTKKNWRPVLVTAPISKELQVGLLDDYMQTYVYDNLAKTDLHGSEYLDFSTYKPITDNGTLFHDSDHLNRHGALVFSYVLLQQLIDKGYVPGTADGYIYASQTE